MLETKVAKASKERDAESVAKTEGSWCVQHVLARVASKMDSDVVAGSVRALLAHFVRAGLGSDSPFNYSSTGLSRLCGAPIHRELPRIYGSIRRRLSPDPAVPVAGPDTLISLGIKPIG